MQDWIAGDLLSGEISQAAAVGSIRPLAWRVAAARSNSSVPSHGVVDAVTIRDVAGRVRAV